MIVWVQVPSPAYAEVAELADAHGSGPCGSNTLRVRLPSSAFVLLRECWNWQTGKTKDLVGVCSCGFKSHLPHTEKRAESFDFIQVFCSFYCLNDTIFVSRCLTFSGGGATISCGGCRADKTSWSFCSVLVRVKM